MFISYNTFSLCEKLLCRLVKQIFELLGSNAISIDFARRLVYLHVTLIILAPLRHTASSRDALGHTAIGLDHATLGQLALRHVALGHVALGHAALGIAAPGHVALDPDLNFAAG